MGDGRTCLNNYVGPLATLLMSRRRRCPDCERNQAEEEFVVLFVVTDYRSL